VQGVLPWLKFKMTNITKPELLVLGTSRVFYIKKEHFLSGTGFYNAGVAVQNLDAYVDFIGSLNAPSLQYIILNLDQWWFNANYFETPLAKDFFYHPHFDYKHGYHYNPLTIIKEFYLKLKNGDLTADWSMKYPENIGLLAAEYNDGVRVDGFYVWTRMIESEQYKNGVGYELILDQIAGGEYLFAPGNGDEIYDHSVKEVEKLLAFCRDRGIMVTAFLPPFAPSIYALLMEKGGYEYMARIYPTLLPLFEQYGFELYDFTDAADIIDDTMSYDGYHPDDRAYRRVLLSMKARGSVIGKFVAGEDDR
jgi:hypothetical protein